MPRTFIPSLRSRVPDPVPNPTPPASAALHFRRAQRLTHAREFDAVYDHKVRKHAGPLMVFGLRNQSATSRLGLAVGRRVGGAVVRNRIKRLLREAFRLQRHTLPVGLDLVISVRPHTPLRLKAYEELLRTAVLQIDSELRRRTARRAAEPSPPAIPPQEHRMSSAIEARLNELGIILPDPVAPVAAYIPAKRTGSLLYISGQIPMRAGKLIAQGPVPRVVPLDVAQECARQCAINALAAAKAAIGPLDRIASVVRVGVFVQCEAGYTEQPKVANGASELLVSIFGEPGRHARAAVGSIALPLGAPVEVEVIFEIR